MREEIDEKEYDYVEKMLLINWSNSYINMNKIIKKIARRMPNERLEEIKSKTPWLDW